MADVCCQSVPQPDCTRKEDLTVCACITLNLHISRFEPSGADGNWFKASCSSCTANKPLGLGED